MEQEQQEQEQQEQEQEQEQQEQPHSALRNFCNFWIRATHRKSLFGVHLSFISAETHCHFLRHYSVLTK